jgi:hypothetical protein
VRFYGNRFNRPSPVCGGDRAANMFLRGNGAQTNSLLLDNIESDAAPCATSMNIDATNFEIGNSWIANNNGDGLTVWRCDHGYIHHSHFRDNTDIDVVVGGGPSCRVEDNDIQHNQSHGWAGLGVQWFPQGGGDHTGSTFLRNVISSGVNLLSFGVVVGLHPWDTTHDLTNVGEVGRSSNGNTISGAVLNLTVEAAFSGVQGSVQGNSMSGHQGNNGWGGCQFSSDYTLYTPHLGNIVPQPGWVELQFDNLVCTPQ